MKRPANAHPNPGEELSKTWLAEMLEIIGPSKVKEREIERRIEEHISKCYLILENFQTKSMFFLLDNATLRYLFVSKSTSTVLGYSREEVIKKGFEWLFTLFSEAELAYKKMVMDDLYRFIRTLDREAIFKCTVRYDLVAFRNDGKPVHLLEEMMFPEVSADGEPLITSCFLHDIGDFADDNTRQCKVYLESPDFQEIIFSKKYNVDCKVEPPLSSREIQVLEQFANGLTTMQVAKKLFITENTVKTHRKNILLKLKVQNTAEAIKVSLKKKWLS